MCVFVNCWRDFAKAWICLQFVLQGICVLKWKQGDKTCHRWRALQRAIMVILVAIWALQEARDILTAITRVRLQGDRGQTAITQSVAMHFKDQRRIPAVFFLCTSHATGAGKTAYFTPLSFLSLNCILPTLPQSVCSLLQSSGVPSLNVTTKSLDAIRTHPSCLQPSFFSMQ